MPGAHRSLKLGPDTVAVSAAVAGGQLVEADGVTGKVKVAGAGSLLVLGVALSDAAPVAAPANPLLVSAAQPEVAIAYGPTDVDVQYAANCNFGQALIAAASGQVTPAGAAPAADSVVGRCTEPGGVLATKFGRARLTC